MPSTPNEMHDQAVTSQMDVIRTGRALLLAATLLLLSCGSDDTAPAASTAESILPTEEATPDCGKTNITSDEYGTEIHPRSGPPGTEVTFTGTTLRGEDWEWAPSDRLEAWWNTDTPASEVPGGTPVTDGPLLRLVRVDDMEQCRFETTFTVPDVEPGRYKISVFSWFANPEDGYGLFLPHHFTVTESEPPPCADEHSKSYGQEPPGLWLKDLLLELGAPSGHPLENDDVRDTGTALWIDIPEYDNDPTIYATMLTPVIHPNADESETENEIGTRHSYTLDENYDRGTIRRIDADTIIYTSSEGREVEYEPTDRRTEVCE